MAAIMRNLRVLNRCFSASVWRNTLPKVAAGAAIRLQHTLSFYQTQRLSCLTQNCQVCIVFMLTLLTCSLFRHASFYSPVHHRMSMMSLSAQHAQSVSHSLVGFVIFWPQIGKKQNSKSCSIPVFQLHVRPISEHQK